ncbi:MAG TPA: P1 family peptidase [Acidimicrobiales bacterium]|nr:P1 family peptidase [Acidimicrobiales bacterium]
MVSEVGGVRVGHWTNEAAQTGCTVVLLPEGTVASGEVRGGAPAAREFALLDPSRTVSRIDAVVLTGGSAFGLSAADGVMRFCEERGIGFPTAGGVVPIVVALGLYDLATGDGSVRPGPDAGYAACEAAAPGDVALGRVGAGAGATIAKWQGRDHARPGGLGGAVLRHDELTVAALVAVNAYGDILQPGDDTPRVPQPPIETAEEAFANTTIGLIVTNAVLTKGQCLLIAQSGHDGMSRALSPAHSTADGDALIAAATGEVAAEVEPVRSLAAVAVERAIRSVSVA